MSLWWSPHRSTRFAWLLRSEGGISSAPRGPRRFSPTMCAISPSTAGSSVFVPGSTRRLSHPGKAQTFPDLRHNILTSLGGMWPLTRVLLGQPRALTGNSPKTCGPCARSLLVLLGSLLSRNVLNRSWLAMLPLLVSDFAAIRYLVVSVVIIAS